MALQNIKTGEYLKITGFQADFRAGNLNVPFLIFRDAEQRARFETGLGEYEVYKNGQFNGIGHIENALVVNPDSSKSTKDAILTAGYTAMKSDMFNEWIDA